MTAVLLFAALTIAMAACRESAGDEPDQADAAPRGPEGVLNGGFERASSGGAALPADWFQNLRNTGSKGTISRDEGFSFAGSASVRIAPNRRNDAELPLSLAQEIPAAAYRGREIVFSGRIATEGDARALIGLTSEVAGRPSELSMIFQPPTNGEWVYQEKSYVVPDDPSVRLYIAIWVPDTSGSAWFDDVSVRLRDGGQEAAPAPAAGQGAPAAGRSAPVAGRPEPAAAPALDAEVVVDADRVLRSIPPTLFGANIEWRWNATSLWQEGEQRVDPKALRLADELGVTLIRYPGGIYSDSYHWRDGIGPYDRRPVVRHEPGKADESRPNFGTDEVLALAEDIGAEVMITVNITTGTPQEAAEWVEYVNRDELRVRFWEIGNEPYLRTSSPVTEAATLTPEEYAAKVSAFAQAMKAADPRIKVGIVGGLNEGSYRQMSYPNWNEIVLEAVGEHADFFSVHNAYAPVLTGDERGKDLRTVYRSMLGRPRAIARNLARLAEQLDRHYPPGTPRPFIAVTEWGPIFQFFNEGNYVDHPKTLGSALFVASTLKAFIESDATDLAAFWMLNDFGVLGWIGSANDDFPPNPDWAPTARYYAFQLFSTHFGTRHVASTTRSPTFDTEQVGWSDAEEDVPYLDVIASLSEDGDKLYLLAINKHFDSPVRARIDLRGFVPRSAGSRWLLGGTGIDAHTGTKGIAVPGLRWGEQVQDGPDGRFPHGSPDEIWMESAPIDGLGPAFTHTFPAHSVTSLELTRE